MSVEATWDLRSSSSPRSFCVYTPATVVETSSPSHNPFDAAAAATHAVAQAMVFGTERGSLHYRTYAPPEPRRTTISTSSSNSASTKPQSALGMPQPSQSNRHPSLPRHYFPVDLPNAMPGVVAAVVPAVHTTTIITTTPIFLLLVDDNRGTSAASPGAFAAQLVTLPPLTHTFRPIPTQQPLPRMSCATYHPQCGFVFAAGRTVGCIPVEPLQALVAREEAHANTPSRRGRTNTAPPSSTSPVHKPFGNTNPVLPAPGARSGHDAIAVTSGGTLAVVAVGHAVYAVANNTTNNNTAMKLCSFAQSSQVHPVLVLDVLDPSMDPDWSCLFLASGRDCTVLDIQVVNSSNNNNNNNAMMNSIMPESSSNAVGAQQARHEGTVTLASPILAAATSWPWLVVLTSDGLVSIRSPSCVAIALKTVEVGNRPNDYFLLRTLWTNNNSLHQHTNQNRNNNINASTAPAPWMVAVSYSGQAKVLQCQPDSTQELADRLMRLAIDAFGQNGFPRAELAEALQASFTATSYVGPEPTPHALKLLRQYLEAVLGLAEWEAGGSSSWPTEEYDGRMMTMMTQNQHWNSTMDESANSSFNQRRRVKEAAHQGSFGRGQSQSSTQDRDIPTAVSGRGSVVSSASPPALLTGTALLCLVCAHLAPPNASLANRAAKACVNTLGIVVEPSEVHSDGAVRVCESVAERLLDHVASGGGQFSLNVGSAPNPITSSSRKSSLMEFVEAAVWLLRSCGKHERAIEVLYERLRQQRQEGNGGLMVTSSGSGYSGGPVVSSGGSTRGFWSQIKYDSYTATHLSELWGSGKDAGCQLVLSSSATHRLLENNPRLGLSAFTALHPQNAAQWKALPVRDDPLAHPTFPMQVLKLLKSVQPAVPYGGESKETASPDEAGGPDSGDAMLPLESGRALAVAFLESAIGIATGRPAEEDEFDSLPMEEGFVERLANFHDELSFLLLEGVIAERGDGDDEANDDHDSTPLGKIYRGKVRRLLRWPLCKIRADHFLSALPPSFLQEKALVLGRLGRHEDALRILYGDLKSLDLALQYCDLRHEQIRAKRERDRVRQNATAGTFFEDLGAASEDLYDRTHSQCAYVPLVRVALVSDPEQGTAAAIQVLALRRSAIDRGAALRLLPKDVPVAAVARPFLIPALVESESHVRRLTVVSSLLRARYISLKQQLTSAQLKAQANLHVVPQLRALNLGDPLHSTKPFRARPSTSASSTFPDVMIIKHFFPRNLVIQAQVTHVLEGRSLGDVTFVVAESSEEAIQPSLQVPLKVLPSNVQGSTWCVLSATPQRMDSLAILTCELRYTILDVDSAGLATSAAVSPSGSRTYVEELQDLEVYATHFS